MDMADVVRKPVRLAAAANKDVTGLCADEDSNPTSTDGRRMVNSMEQL
jgi:hypothetical protein